MKVLKIKLQMMVMVLPKEIINEILLYLSSDETNYYFCSKRWLIFTLVSKKFSKEHINDKYLNVVDDIEISIEKTNAFCPKHSSNLEFYLGGIPMRSINVRTDVPLAVFWGCTTEFLVFKINENVDQQRTIYSYIEYPYSSIPGGYSSKEHTTHIFPRRLKIFTPVFDTHQNLKGGSTLGKKILLIDKKLERAVKVLCKSELKLFFNIEPMKIWPQ